MVRIVYTAAVDGIDGMIVTVEASFGTRPKHMIEIIGLPDAAVKEAASRVVAVVKACDLDLSRGTTVVNLAPANIKKEGSAYDLAILLSTLKCEALENFDFSDKCFIGELSLTGEIRAVNGVLSMATAARDAGFKEIYVPAENAAEAAAARGITVYGIQSVTQLLEAVSGEKKLKKTVFDYDAFMTALYDKTIDFADVKGQENAKLALEYAAAGRHNIMMIGAPGTGKSMLASRVPTILPPMTLEEATETTRIHSVAGVLASETSLLTSRPYRSPHHTISAVGLAGGGKMPKPGEISLAHNGVLFLDELPEFDKSSMEILRQPLENGEITITRAGGTVTFPCSFMLVTALNPCRCGNYGHPTLPCTCSPAARMAYFSKISGPLLDRIDIQIWLQPLGFDTLTTNSVSESSAYIRKRVAAAREFARKRFSGETVDGKMPLLYNSQMRQAHIRKFCALDNASKALMKNAYDRLGLTGRGYDKILRLARTVADFDRSDSIKADHIAVAINYRSFDYNNG